jgi:hypothetical protein
MPADDLRKRVLGLGRAAVAAIADSGHEPRKESAVGHVGRTEDDPEQLTGERTDGLSRHLGFS